MKTIRIFQENVYLSEATAVVEKVDGELVVLNQTIFFPTGGGQSCDLGQINNFSVVDVTEDEEYIWHRVKDHSLEVGQEVSLAIDWNRRFDNMQRHCGEHIMSGMWFREYGGVNRGFHMGDDYMTMDIALEKDPNYQEITWEMAQHIEDCTNEAIWQNLPVITRHFESKKEAKGLPLRKELNIDKDITIVCVGSIENPSDCVACCGTHPATSGQVGLVKIFKVEKNKGMFRIYFEAGKRAAKDFAQKHDLVTKLGNKYSAGVDDLMKKIEAQEEKTKELKAIHAKLRNSIIAIRSQEILDAVETCQEKFLLYRYDDMQIDDLLNVGRPLMDKLSKLLVIVHEESNTALLFSDGKTADCGKLVKENADIYRGKGGGNKNNARAIFPNKDMLDTYLQLLGMIL